MKRLRNIKSAKTANNKIICRIFAIQTKTTKNMDTMISLANQMAPMTMDDVRTKCPYAFAEAPTNPGVSEKYTYANTETVINDMARLGWYPVEAKQCRHKKGSSGIRSFHMLAMESADPRTNIVDQNGNVEAKVRIIIQNSHDGFNSFRFMMGCYRFVCSNGMVVADAQFADFSIRHINYSFDELRGIVAKVMESVPATIDKMNTMNTTILTDDQKREMAVETYKIRKGYAPEDDINVDDQTVEDLMTPVRTEDEGNSLWNVFNVLQEKMIKGSFMAPGKNGKNRKQRPITSIKKDLDYNERLWAVAEQYIPVAD
jgi:hypothetical protein